MSLVKIWLSILFFNEKCLYWDEFMKILWLNIQLFAFPCYYE